MRKVIVVIFTFLSLFSGVARADFINVISQEYSIRGMAGYYLNDPNYGSPFIVSYQETSNLPVSDHTTWPSGSYAGYAYAESSAGGGVTTNDASVNSYAYEMDLGDATGQAYASASITFSPLVTTMLVSAYSQEAGVTLVDVTSVPITLYSYVDIHGSESFLMSFDLSHIYRISTFADFAEGVHINGSLSIESVPEPATVLLLGFGVVGLLGFRRKFKR